MTAVYKNIAPTAPGIILLFANPPQNIQYLAGTTYNYYRSTNPGAEGANPYRSGVDQNSVLDSYNKTSVDQPFYFQASVAVGGVEGPRSNEIEVTVSAFQPPPAPVLTALYKNIAPTSPATILLFANPPQNIQYLAGTTYNYYRSTNPGGEGANPYRSGVDQTSILDSYTKTSVDQPFYFQVSVSVGGVEGPRSGEIEVTVSPAGTIRAPILNGYFKNTDSAGGSVNLQLATPSGYQFPAGTTFNVYRSTISGGEGSTVYRSGLAGGSLVVRYAKTKANPAVLLPGQCDARRSRGPTVARARGYRPSTLCAQSAFAAWAL